MKRLCAYCGLPHGRPVSAVNRAAKTGAPLFCDRRCSGLAHRRWKSKAQRVEEKRLYDIRYRAKNLDRIKEAKRIAFQKNYDPKAAAIDRKKNMPRHVEYCRQPRYLAWKRVYDAKYRAKKYYGQFWEAALAASYIETEVSSRMSKYDIALANGTINKAQQRRRAYESQVSPHLVGN